MRVKNPPNNKFVEDPAQAMESLSNLIKKIQGLGRPCILYLQISMGREEIAILLSQSFVAGIILQSENRELLAAFPNSLGYCTKNATEWLLPAKGAADMVYIGSWTDFGARAAWLAWSKGIRRIHYFSFSQSNTYRKSFSVAAEKSLRSLQYRLWQSPLRKNLAKIHSISFFCSQIIYSQKISCIKKSKLTIAVSTATWQKEKIVLVGGTLGPGGAERQITATLLGLSAHGYSEIHFLHHSAMQKPNDFFLPQLIDAGISYSQVKLFEINPVSLGIDPDIVRCLMTLGDLGNEVVAYTQEFLSRRPEVVHVWLDQMNVVAGLAALLVGVPRIVLSCRSLSPKHFPFIQPYMRPIYRLLARFPNVTFLNNSKAGAKDYLKWIGIKPVNGIRVVRNGFDFSKQPSSAELLHLRREYRQRLGIPQNAPVVGVVMRLSEEKRPLLWLEIAKQIAQKNSEAHFLIVGDGPMYEKVLSAGCSALHDRLHFPGNERNVMMAMSAMDIFLLTSKVEGLPNVLIETQSIGVPVVAIDVGGVRETIKNGETGWFFKSSDPIFIGKTISNLISNTRMIEDASCRAKKFIKNRFGLNQMISNTLSSYGYSKI